MSTVDAVFSAVMFSAHMEPPSSPRRSSQLVSLFGELDAAACETLCHVAARAGEHDLVIDLSQVSFIDAAGLGCLLNLRHSRSSRGRTVTLFGAAPRVHRLFSLLKLDGLLSEPPPPDPGATGQTSVATSVQTRSGPVSLPTDTGHLRWQSRLFVVTAWVRFEPRAVDVAGDFGSPAAETILQRVLTRLQHYQASIRSNLTA